MESGPSDNVLELVCAQVPNDFGPESDVWVWLGSDNNKGKSTSWTQGIRALGRCEEKEKLANKSYRIVVRVHYVLPRSVEKLDVLRVSPLTYADSLHETPIVGLNNYSSQVVQTMSDEQFETLAAIIARFEPEISDDLLRLIPAAADIEIREAALSDEETSDPVPRMREVTLHEGDAILKQVLEQLGDNVGGVLLTGAPGTGKSWYADEIANFISNGDTSKVRKVQFHPSYQYEDFVEGYVPTGSGGFKMEKKHLLLACETARKTDDFVVLIIDEFSRTDPSRVMGEVLTYMEDAYRDKPFFLPSGRKVSIPNNLIFLATMNPEDRSVDEIDDAMDRRWAKIALNPDASVVATFLQKNGANPVMIEPVVTFFNELQRHTPVGHAFFRTVRDLPSLQRLWESQLRHILAKKYRYDPKGRQQLEGEWQACQASVSARLNAGPGEPTTPLENTPAPDNA